ncbi:MAG: response regulator transcription factor [Candidatus Thiodiazotropha sp.]|nr:response regulator transcription factor [Candidatus Thiodiazotropha sp.]
MAELVQRPRIDEMSDNISKQNQMLTNSLNTGSKGQVIPITKKILICSAEEAIALRWSEALSGVGRLSTASNREAISTILEANRPEIVLIDLLLFGEDYRQIPQLLCHQYPHVAFVFLSPEPNDVEGLFLISQGGRGYCNRYISKALLIKAVELVRLGEVWVGRKLLFKLMNRLSSMNHTSEDEVESRTESKLSKLTDREREIAVLIGSGDSNKVIANKLDITERTVKAHLSSIFRKTATKDRLQLGLLINVEQ